MRGPLSYFCVGVSGYQQVPLLSPEIAITSKQNFCCTGRLYSIVPSSTTSSCQKNSLAVTLGHTFQFIFLLNGIRIWRTLQNRDESWYPAAATTRSTMYLGSVDKFISQTFSDGLYVTKSRFSGTSAKKPDGLVHSSKWRNIHSLHKKREELFQVWTTKK